MNHKSGRDFRLMVEVNGQYRLLDGEVSLSGAVSCEYVENSIKKEDWATTTQSLGVRSVAIKASGVVRTGPEVSVFKHVRACSILGDSVKFRIKSGVDTFLEGEALVQQLEKDNGYADAQRYSLALESISIVESKDDIVIEPPPETCIVATPILSPSSGEITVNQTIVIFSATSSASIFYTLDGSDPKVFGVLYTSPINIPVVGSYTVTAYAKCEEGTCTCEESSVVSGVFDVVPEYAGETWGIEGASVGVSVYKLFRNRTIGPSYTITL